MSRAPGEPKHPQRPSSSKGYHSRHLLFDDIEQEHQRMEELGAVFTMKPTKTPGPTIAVFDDTCGNLIQIYQV